MLELVAEILIGLSFQDIVNAEIERQSHRSSNQFSVLSHPSILLIEFQLGWILRIHPSINSCIYPMFHRYLISKYPLRIPDIDIPFLSGGLLGSIDRWMDLVEDG